MATLDRILVGSAVILALTLAGRWLGPKLAGTETTVMAASWAETPKSLEETAGLARMVVLGRVTRVRRGEDLVVRNPDLPAGEDRIPTEVVTIRLERTYKGPDGGGPPETIELFRTGLSTGTDQLSVVDDPPYAPGEQYVLFVTGGPELRVDGASQRLLRVVSPEGRYQVRGGAMEPAARHGFAAGFRGRRLQDFEGEVNRGIERARQVRR